MDIKNILIDKISPSPINPRKSFDGAACPDEKSGDVIGEGLILSIRMFLISIVLMYWFDF